MDSGTQAGKLSIEAARHKLQRDTFDYFLHETNPANGVVIDKTAPNWPASIAAQVVGLRLEASGNAAPGPAILNGPFVLTRRTRLGHVG